MKMRSIARRLCAAAAFFSLSAAGTAIAAGPSGAAAPDNIRIRTEMAEERGSPLSCQKRNFDDHIAVCCAHQRGGRTYHRQYSRKQCRDLKGTEVAKAKCAARHGRSDDPAKGLVCCRTRKSSFKGVYGKAVFNWVMMPAERCKTAPAGLVVDIGNCVRHRTARDRMLECKKRGKGWVWKDGRCRRAAVRDRRNR